MRGFPALADEGSSVSVRIMDSEERARQTTRRGLRRLFALQIGPEIRYLRKNLPGIEQIRLQYTKVSDRKPDEDSSASLDISDDLFGLIVDLTFIDGRPEIWDKNS